MTNSQNGWPASRDAKSLGVVSPTVEGVTFPQGVKSGDVQTVLMYVAEQFHKTVEPLRAGWCWGFFYKPIEGSSEVSNHASGTAIDINAPAHPMGSSGTFTSAKVAAIRKILNFCEGVVRWGGDYTGRKDEMHFEINANSSAVARIANKIKNSGSQEDDMPLTDAEIVKIAEKVKTVSIVNSDTKVAMPLYARILDIENKVNSILELLTKK